MRENPLQNEKDYLSQFLPRRTKLVEEIVSRTPPFKNAFKLLYDDFPQISAETEVLKNRLGDYDES